MKYYAGIGSRKTPANLKEKMLEISMFLNDRGYILRSGGAEGADTFFENGAGARKEIFLPWKDFNNNKSPLYEQTEDAFKMAERYHPLWNQLSQGAKKLMARNCHQVLGFDLCTPVEFIVCWTRNGEMTGGTGQALRIAKDLEIPVFNLYNPDAEKRMRSFVNAQLF